MSEFVFFELQPETRREMKLPPHPIPVRRDRQGEVFLPGGHVDFPAMLEEVRVFLDENPALEGAYAHLVAMLAYLSGMDAASRGFHEQALHIYEMGLDAVPESVSLRSHYALSLQCLGREVEARREIEEVIAQTPKDKILPVLWMILARIYARGGEYEKAYWLLKDVSTIIPDEDGFWDFLGEMEEKAGLRPAAEPPAVSDDTEFTVNVGTPLRAQDFVAADPVAPAAPVFAPAPTLTSTSTRACARCRSPLAPAAKFCLECGAPAAPLAPPPPVAPAAAAKCGACRADLPPGAKLCLAGGARVGAPPAPPPPPAPAPPPKRACTACGAVLGAATKFCTSCGARAA